MVLDSEHERVSLELAYAGYKPHLRGPAQVLEGLFSGYEPTDLGINLFDGRPEESAAEAFVCGLAIAPVAAGASGQD